MTEIAGDGNRTVSPSDFAIVSLFDDFSFLPIHLSGSPINVLSLAISIIAFFLQSASTRIILL